MTDIWPHTSFLRATPGGAPVEEWGYKHRGLVMRHHGWATPREDTCWSLVHLGSGGTILRLVGRIAVVMSVAAEIAECSDWTLFDLPDGWKQTDPDLPAKVGAICEAHPEARPDTSFMATPIANEDARAVVAAREAANAE